MSDRNNAVPGLFTILNQVVDGLATRLQIASIELSVAKNLSLIHISEPTRRS